jgi:hypothetical protein
MTPRLLRISTLVVITILLLVMPSSAVPPVHPNQRAPVPATGARLFAPPPLPYSPWGTVKVNGQNVPEGTVIGAWCGGVKVAETLSEVNLGESGYGLDIPHDNPDTPGKDGCADGETVAFTIGLLEAEAQKSGSPGEPIEWVSGVSEQVNLTVETEYSPWGTVKVDFQHVDAGTVIGAWCGGIKVAETLTEVAGAESVYGVEIPSDNPDTPEKDGCVEGETVAFTIGLLEAEAHKPGSPGEPIEWAKGVWEQVNLTAETEYSPYGTVKVNFQHVDAGTVIGAWCAGVKVAQTLSEVNLGESGYGVDIPRDNPDTPEKEGCLDGEVVAFTIGLLEAEAHKPGSPGEPVEWVSGVSEQVNLTAETEYSPWGTVKVNFQHVDAGTVIGAWCDGVKVAETLTEVAGAESVYGVDIPSDNPDTPEKEGCLDGEIVAFTIGLLEAEAHKPGSPGEPVEWASGVSEQVNLTAETEYSPWGTVKVNGQHVDAGTVIGAWCEGVKVAETLTEVAGAESVYGVDIPSDNPDTPEKEGCADGEIIAFTIGLLEAEAHKPGSPGEPVEWASGVSEQVNLTAETEYSPWGTVKVNGQNVDAGTVIGAWCEGVKVAETLSEVAGEESVYGVDIPSDNPDTPEKEGCLDGEVVAFTIGLLEAEAHKPGSPGEPVEWVSGVSEQVNLTAETEKRVYLPMIQH